MLTRTTTSLVDLDRAHLIHAVAPWRNLKTAASPCSNQDTAHGCATPTAMNCSMRSPDCGA